MGFNWESGMILLFDAVCPTAWTNISTYNGKYIKMTATVGAIGTTGGTTQHRHSVNPGSQNSASGAPSYNYFNCSTSATNVQNWGGHVHPVNPGSVYSDYNNNNPGYLDMIMCKKD